MREIYISMAGIALLWGGWPLVSRTAGETGNVGSLVLVTTAVVPVLFSVWCGGGIFTPSGSSVIKLGIAGLMMGTGLVMFSPVVESQLMEASTSIPIIDVLMISTTVIGGILFFNESVTVTKITGIALCVIGIFLLHSSIDQ